ncbi:deazaflavin-dependent oxidoreductase (nitroreductase family) [Thermocatellispora tengchongensis]|uniref:Deazaflavin-dependent oxidoreductase (Nitroreductase family) n=1 Tax=Thermocatellispora tengchongensis TaxID=1073253 RepID=A0A840P6F6_9ACTN|nr:nitroreductase family deazaflavin-dependent oxidoreductase [Thermocatellispora tengchongensis]MBB5134579.1 deazaflavin-dependent oxidoreductase (nitroreductase family) [Thermocatellispora tengchongensis]
MRVADTPRPPTGFRRLVWRLPILLYRVGLDRLLGERVMLLTHTGRVSGRPRQAVIEVVARTGDGYVAASGFGPRADWYRNLMKTPEAVVRVGGRVVPVVARPLTGAEGGRIMERYAARHPRAARRLCRVMGFAVDGGVADCRAVGERVPFVCFTPSES